MNSTYLLCVCVLDVLGTQNEISPVQYGCGVFIRWCDHTEV